MRPADAPVAGMPAQQYKSMDERDAALESRYRYDLGAERTTMAFVSANVGDLVEEFFAWRRREVAIHHDYGEGVLDAVKRWESLRFGAELDQAPHGLLLFRVRCRLTVRDGGRPLDKHYADLTLPATSEDPDARPAPNRSEDFWAYLRRCAIALGYLAPETKPAEAHTMPPRDPGQEG